MWTAYRAPLEVLKIIANSPSFQSVLRTLDAAVSECCEIAENTAGDLEEIAETIIDEQCDVTENLLGAALVVCQAQINAVVSTVQKLHEMAKKAGTEINKPQGKAILSVCCDKVAGKISTRTTYTQIQVIEAAANYFKHNDEWVRPWDEQPENITTRKKTVEIITTIGAKEGSTGNLRTFFKALGLPDYSPSKLGAIVTKWTEEIRTCCEKELKRHKLIE